MRVMPAVIWRSSVRLIAGNRLFAAALIPALALRVAAELGYRWQSWFNDSFSYVRAAVTLTPNTTRPSGYPLYLWLLSPAHSYFLVTASQHLMGPLVAGMIYALARHRFGVPAWIAVLATLPVLYDGFEIQLEHLIMADTLFLFLAMAAVTVALWSPRPSWRACLVAGLLLGASSLVRPTGLPLLAALAVYVVVVHWRAWRALVVGLVACGAACAVPVLGYTAWYSSAHGEFAMTDSTGVFDGTIECEVKMTGIVFTAAHPGGDHPYSTEVAPGLGAPVHQHLFSARLDMSVDGHANAVEEVDVTGLPIGPDNPYGNAIAQRVTRLSSEAGAARPGDAARGRVWRVLSTERVNRFGRPTAFTLHPEPAPALLANPDSPLAARAGFASRALWVTRYDPAQRYPAGDFVNQCPGGGLPAYVAGDRDIDGQDIVVWHTFGPTHVVRTEDWPVMPVTRTGFMLKPTGFFDRNPTLDVPAPAGHCSAEHD